MRKYVKTIIFNNKMYNIECENSMCGECEYKPVSTDLKCKLFDSMLDHLVSGHSISSGWKRCNFCLDSEKK